MNNTFVPQPLTIEELQAARKRFAEQMANFPPDGIVNAGGHRIDLSEFRPKHEPEYEGDSRDAAGKTWRDREPLL